VVNSEIWPLSNIVQCYAIVKCFWQLFFEIGNFFLECTTMYYPDGSTDGSTAEKIFTSCSLITFLNNVENEMLCNILYLVYNSLWTRYWLIDGHHHWEGDLTLFDRFEGRQGSTEEMVENEQVRECCTTCTTWLPCFKLFFKCIAIDIHINSLWGHFGSTKG